MTARRPSGEVECSWTTYPSGQLGGAAVSAAVNPPIRSSKLITANEQTGSQVAFTSTNLGVDPPARREYPNRFGSVAAPLGDGSKRKKKPASSKRRTATLLQ